MNRTQNRRRRGIKVPVASMGDIAFLLIIFFMICSNFARDAHLDLTPPLAPDLETLEESNISVSIDVEGRIYIQGEEVAGAEAVEAAVRAWIAGRPSDEQHLVLFKCDAAVDKEVFEPVLDAISQAGGVIAAVGDRLQE